MGAFKTRIWIPFTLLFCVGAGALLVAPPIIRGLAALEWLNHYRSLESLPRPTRVLARTVAVRTDAAIRNLAPLPQASEAAMLALEIGQRAQFEGHDREAARLIYEGVRDACARVRTRLLSGPGFAVIQARAQALEASLGAGAAP